MHVTASVRWETGRVWTHWPYSYSTLRAIRSRVFDFMLCFFKVTILLPNCSLRAGLQSTNSMPSVLKLERRMLVHIATCGCQVPSEAMITDSRSYLLQNLESCLRLQTNPKCYKSCCVHLCHETVWGGLKYFKQGCMTRNNSQIWHPCALTPATVGKPRPWYIVCLRIYITPNTVHLKSASVYLLRQYLIILQGVWAFGPVRSASSYCTQLGHCTVHQLQLSNMPDRPELPVGVSNHIWSDFQSYASFKLQACDVCRCHIAMYVAIVSVDYNQDSL